jgi:hypothetical protein
MSSTPKQCNEMRPLTSDLGGKKHFEPYFDIDGVSQVVIHVEFLQKKSCPKRIYWLSSPGDALKEYT